MVQNYPQPLEQVTGGDRAPLAEITDTVAGEAGIEAGVLASPSEAETTDSAAPYARLSAEHLARLSRAAQALIIAAGDEAGQPAEHVATVLETLGNGDFRAMGRQIVATLTDMGELDTYAAGGVTYVTLAGYAPRRPLIPKPTESLTESVAPPELDLDEAFTEDELALARAIMDTLVACKHPDQRLIQKELYEDLHPDMPIRDFRKIVRRLSDRGLLHHGLRHTRKEGTFLFVKWSAPDVRRQ